MHVNASTRLLLAFAPLMTFSGCNSGLAGLVSATSSSGSSSTSVATTVSNVTVTDAKNSPAVIGFTLAGQSVDAVHIEYLPPSAGLRLGANDDGYVPIATLGADDLAISSSGEANRYDWAFADDLGTGSVDGLVVRVRLNSGASGSTIEPIRVGNSPPVISPFSFSESEVIGVVGMLFTVADTDDTVTLSVEVNAEAENSFPEGSWETALPALGEELVPFVAAESGTTLSFFWDVVGQYGPLDSEVMVRATVVDTADPGEEPLRHQVESGTFLRVDNNAPPVVDFDDISFALSSDQRLGIVVPYTVSDAEGDTPDLVFQWSREGEPFVDLPDDEALIEAILEDPALREQFRIATPYPMRIGGLAQPTSEPDTALLPELGSGHAHLLQVAEQPGGDLTGALDGYELELLRASKIPEPLATSWLTHPLDGPVAALPTEELTTAYVLDRAGASGWRVREIDLATGAVLSDVANGTGEPDTMTMEHGGAALLVAAHVGSVPRVDRLDLQTLEVRAIADGFRPLPGDTVRGLLSIGTDVALATSGGALVRLDYADPFATNVATVLDGLVTPWGLAADRAHGDRCYLAERDGGIHGRVLTVYLHAGTVDELPVDAPGLPHPEGLAVERGGRLLVLTDETPGDGTKELRSLQLGSAQVEVLTTGLPASATRLVTGPDDLRLLSLGNAGDLAAGGGVVQRRTIVGYDPARRVATVDAAFAPTLTSAHPWRVQSPARLAVEAGVPRSSAFVWDSRDMPGGHGRALLRLTARDADASVVEHDGGKQVLSGLAGEPLALGGPMTTAAAYAVALADLDGDGDDDIASANFASATLTVFFQKSPGVFDPEPDLTLGGPATTNSPTSPVAADLDGDGDLDLVSTNLFTDTITVFFQTGPGVFPLEPSLTLGGPTTSAGGMDVATADLDGDGDVDIVSVNSTVSVFFQTGPGVFDPSPSLTLGTPEETGGALSVATADLDGDGDVDIVTGNHGQDPDFGAVTVFFQTGPGVFDPEPSVILDIAVANDVVPLDVATADLDGDGDEDIVTANFGGDTVTVFFQTEPGVFDPVPSLTLGAGAAGVPTGVVAADMDGDGDLDLVSANAAGDTLSVFFQTGAGAFATSSLLELGGPETTDGAWKVAAADLDGNGAVDLVSASQFSNTVAVFLQSEAGGIPTEPSQTLGAVFSTAYSGGIATADFDGDGDVDIVSANAGLPPLVGSSLTMYFQTAGVLDPVPLFLGNTETIQGVIDVAAADLDGDGDVDIVTANGIDLDSGNLQSEGLDTLTVFFQTEAGAFDLEPSLTLGGPATTDGAVSVAAADLDGDGDIDIVSANEVSSTLTVFFQTAAGVFDPVPSLTLGDALATEGAGSVAVADLDGDGDTDIASANANTLTVFFQTAAGVFDAAPSLTLGGPTTTQGADCVRAADVDGDGDADLVSANRIAGTLTVFVQTEAGVFEPVPALTLEAPLGTAAPRSVTVADLDDDGDMDFASSNPGRGSPGGPGNNKLTVFLQTNAGSFDIETLTLSGLPTVLTSVPVDLSVVDMDGDGDADIVSANGSAANLTIFYGTHKP